MQLNTYLSFNGDTQAAFEFYAQLLGGSIETMMRFGDVPGCPDMGEGTQDKIMHASLLIEGQRIMGTDATPMYPYQGIKGAHVVINVGDPAHAERLFAALSDGGKVEMPMNETFWAKRYGILTDRFGVPWMVNCALPT